MMTEQYVKNFVLPLRTAMQFFQCVNVWPEASPQRAKELFTR